MEGSVVIKALHVAYIHSSRGPELAEWFEKMFGLETSFADEGWHEFEMASGSRFAIDKTHEPASEVERQPIMLSFLVEDIHVAVNELRAKGIVFNPSEDPVFDVGPTLVATFADPEGNWHQLSQPKKSS